MRGRRVSCTPLRAESLAHPCVGFSHDDSDSPRSNLEMRQPQRDQVIYMAGREVPPLPISALVCDRIRQVCVGGGLRREQFVFHTLAVTYWMRSSGLVWAFDCKRRWLLCKRVGFRCKTQTPLCKTAKRRLQITGLFVWNRVKSQAGGLSYVGASRGPSHRQRGAWHSGRQRARPGANRETPWRGI